MNLDLILVRIPLDQIVEAHANLTSNQRAVEAAGTDEPGLTNVPQEVLATIAMHMAMEKQSETRTD